MTNAIRSSEDLLSSLVDDRSNKVLIEDIRRDLRRMKGRASKFESALQSAIASSGCKRLPRKRFKSEQMNEKYISRIKSIRRRKRPSTEMKKEYVSNVSCEYDLEQSNIDSESSVDSEVDDATYVPETFTNTKQRRKRKTNRKMGDNECSVTDKEDVFAEDYECLNAKYQFALDLKKMDVAPGELFAMQKAFNFQFSTFTI